MKTRLDVVEFAFRRLGIKAEDESLSADQLAYAGSVLDGIHSELTRRGHLPWWPDQIEDGVAVALGNMLAAEIGPSYSVVSEPRAAAFARLMASMRQDNRADAPEQPVYY